MKKILALLLILTFFLACTESELLTNNETPSFKSDKSNGNPAKIVCSYPLKGEQHVDWVKEARGFKGCTIKLEDGTKLKIDSLTFKAPKGTKKRKGVDITVEVDTIHTIRGTELNFTFGPHGSRFKQPARIELNWARLGVDVANLYYILDDGSYELQQPDQIDIKNKKMILYVDHFSRYAVAYGN